MFDVIRISKLKGRFDFLRLKAKSIGLTKKEIQEVNNIRSQLEDYIRNHPNDKTVKA